MNNFEEQADNQPRWFILGKDKKKFGKYTTQQMLDYYNQGKINDETFIACLGMKSWQKLKDTELMQHINEFVEDEFIAEDFGGDYEQASSSKVDPTNNGYSSRQNSVVNDKTPFTAFEKLGIIGISFIVGLVGLIVGIINVKYPSRRKFSIFLIVFYAISFIFTMSLFSSIGKKDTSKSNTVKTDNEIGSNILDGNDNNWETDDFKYNYDATNDTLTIEANEYEENQTVDNPIDVKSSDFTIDKDYSFQDDDGWHTVIVITVNAENKAVRLSATAYDTNNIIVDEMESWVNVPKGNQGVIELYPGYYSDLEGRTDLRYEYTWKTYVPPFPTQDFGYEIEDSQKKGEAVEITVRQTGDDSDFYGHSPCLLVFKNGTCVGTGEFIIGDKLKGKGTACYVEANGEYRLKDFDTWEIYRN